MFDLGIFENKIAIYEVSTLEFLKNEFLNHSVNFGVAFRFSKSRAPTFSEGLGPGPLYKV